MKCLILAGGKGERLWPLSRKNYPKQFIEVSGRHSMFQDTVARNIPFCDEFIVVTSSEYKFLVENQLKVFQGISYRMIYEEVGRRTTASIALACMDLNPSDFVFVVACDHMIEADEEYRNAIVKAKEYAGSGKIVVFGKEETNFDSRYGYINANTNTFVEKPDISTLDMSEKYLRNLGMIICRAGDVLSEIKKFDIDAYKNIREAFMRRGRSLGDTTYMEEVLNRIPAISIERFVLEKTSKLVAVPATFPWDELTNLEDLEKFSYKADGVSVVEDCTNTTVLNNSSTEAVVVNGLEDVIVVNTDDALYVGKKGTSPEIKNIIKSNDNLKPYAIKSNRTYRQWGYYVTLNDGENYHVRQVVLLPGKTIYAHKHQTRAENWMIVKGEAKVTINDEVNTLHAGDSVIINENYTHQISNIGNENVEFIESSYGTSLQEEENSPRLQTKDLNELDLGVKVEPLVKLKPIFKDFLWGGTHLISDFGMKCDYDIVAEAWVMSAHPDGQSVVNSGRHRGMRFGNYIHTVGKDILGWKCSPLQEFPLLVKFIDANKDLSIQVHPGDEYAMEVENQYGKNEMWYVVSSEEDAGLYVGFNKDVTTDEVREAVNNGTITSLLNFYPTHPGDVFYIPAGTVHAIGAGNVIAEIQQSSTCTYRLYDFDRVDKFGNKRELHLDKALAVLNTNKYEGQDLSDDSENNLVCRNKYFTVSRMVVNEAVTMPVQNESFMAIIAINGNGTVCRDGQKAIIKAGEVVFVTAGDGTVTLDGDYEALICRV
ncbi:MAG: cupin domain-containing protein [Saccharofermentans sp.]|nr:cupin domain-containing protein [Saccharofermentans sp.]